MSAGTPADRRKGFALFASGHTRRDFLRLSGGVAVAGAAGAALLGAPRRSGAAGAERHIRLWVNEGFRTMVDETRVYTWAFSDTVDGLGTRRGRVDPDDPFPDHLSFFPDATLRALEGEQVSMTVTNALDEDHSFVIEDRRAHRDVVNSGRIAPGATWTGSFPAPAAGTYIFQDTLERPANRLLGLHGTFVVMPRQPTVTSPGTPLAAYSSGEPVLFERQLVWELHGVDPVWAEIASAGPFRADDLPPFLARYFTINNRSGIDAFASAGAREDTTPHGHMRPHDEPGQLIRLANVGANVHGAHFHGNHVEIVARQARVLSRSGVDAPHPDDDAFIDLVMERDMVRLDPLDTADVVLPFEAPRDIATPERSLAPGSVFDYPMHSHAEMSQTAGGGLYPNGMLTDWELKL
jgi:FtsP/CotA-like multicopper oxidase with cupredoxin domain